MKVCADCHHHRAAPAGRYYDRCEHPKASDGSIIRNERPRCMQMRWSIFNCGPWARWFEPRRFNTWDRTTDGF